MITNIKFLNNIHIFIYKNSSFRKPETVRILQNDFLFSDMFLFEN